MARPRVGSPIEGRVSGLVLDSDVKATGKPRTCLGLSLRFSAFFVTRGGVSPDVGAIMAAPRPTMAPDEVLEFGAFRLEIAERRLSQGNAPVALPPKLFDTLVLLVRDHGRLVPKDVFMQTIWPDAFVSEATLAHNISALRKLLGHTEEHPIIETVAKKGYRFVAEVRQAGGETGREDSGSPSGRLEAGRTTTVEAAAGIVPTDPPPHRAGAPAWFSASIAAVVLITAAALLFWSFDRRQADARPGRVMLAVLPLDNLTGDAADDYFSEGVTEEMITRLGSLDPERLGVIARTSVVRFKQTGGAIDQLGEQFGVQYVLEGSVRRDAAKVRIAAQLIRLSDHSEIWAHQYDRALAGVLDVQAEIAGAVSREVQVALSENGESFEISRPLASPAEYQAYDLYLRGRYALNKRSIASLRQAIGYFEHAVSLDPRSARGYAGLADSYALASAYALDRPEVLIPKARAAVSEALARAPDLAEAHAALAMMAQNYDWDWKTAGREYRRSIELNANYATAHHWYAEHLALQGRFDEALAEMRRARELDPLSPIMAADRAAILYFARQFEPAVQQFQSVLDMEPGVARAHMIVYAYVQAGRMPEALEHVREWRQAYDSPWPRALMVYVYGHMGESTKAREALRELEELNRIQPMIDPAPMSVGYLGFGMNDEALKWLEKACDEHSPTITALKVDPVYDPVRQDPRFQALLRRIGLS